MEQVITQAQITLAWVGLVALSGGLGVVIVAALIASPNPSRILKPIAWLLCAAVLLLMFAGVQFD